jgi:hypothetical protein
MSLFQPQSFPTFMRLRLTFAQRAIKVTDLGLGFVTGPFVEFD